MEKSTIFGAVEGKINYLKNEFENLNLMADVGKNVY